MANIEFKLVDEIVIGQKVNQAQLKQENNTYRLVSKKRKRIIQNAENVSFKMDGKIVVNRQRIAYELGIVDKDASPEVASKQAKDQFGMITIFFFMVYGFSQLFSGKLYDKTGTRRRFVVSVFVWVWQTHLHPCPGGKYL